MNNVKAKAKILNNKTKTKGRLGSSKKEDIVADWKKLTKKGKKGTKLQEMREFLIGEGYHPDDIEEMVSMTTLDADEFEETFGLNEYEEMGKKCKTKCTGGKTCCDGKCYAPDAEDRPPLKKCYQEADFEFGKEEEYEEMEKTVKPPRTPKRRRKKGKNQEPSTINYINPHTFKRDMSRLGKKGKGTRGMMNPSNLEYIRTEVQGKSSKRNKGVKKWSINDQMNKCVEKGRKVGVYSKSTCVDCCTNKFKTGLAWSTCKNRCENKFPGDEKARENKMANRIRKKNSSKGYQDLKF